MEGGVVGVRDYHMDQPKHAKELAKLLLTTMLLQPPHPPFH